jgi:hypothetical protein
LALVRHIANPNKQNKELQAPTQTNKIVPNLLLAYLMVTKYRH